MLRVFRLCFRQIGKLERAKTKLQGQVAEIRDQVSVQMYLLMCYNDTFWDYLS